MESLFLYQILTFLLKNIVKKQFLQYIISVRDSYELENNSAEVDTCQHIKK